MRIDREYMRLRRGGFLDRNYIGYADQQVAGIAVIASIVLASLLVAVSFLWQLITIGG